MRDPLQLGISPKPNGADHQMDRMARTIVAALQVLNPASDPIGPRCAPKPTEPDYADCCLTRQTK